MAPSATVGSSGAAAGSGLMTFSSTAGAAGAAFGLLQPSSSSSSSVFLTRRGFSFFSVFSFFAGFAFTGAAPEGTATPRLYALVHIRHTSADKMAVTKMAIIAANCIEPSPTPSPREYTK